MENCINEIDENYSLPEAIREAQATGNHLKNYKTNIYNK